MNKSICSIIILLVAFFSVNLASAQGQPKYIHKPTYEDGKLMSKIVYQFDNYKQAYVPKQMYEYTYEEDDRISSCTKSSWNTSTQSWETASLKTYSYNDVYDNLIYVHTEWNNRKQAYNLPKEIAVLRELTQDMIAAAI